MYTKARKRVFAKLDCSEGKVFPRVAGMEPWAFSFTKQLKFCRVGSAPARRSLSTSFQAVSLAAQQHCRFLGKTARPCVTCLTSGSAAFPARIRFRRRASIAAHYSKKESKSKISSFPSWGRCGCNGCLQTHWLPEQSTHAAKHSRRTLLAE